MFNYLIADIFMNYCAGSIKQSDSSHKLLSTDPGSIRNGARVYSSYVAGMLKGQEAEDKDYCNQKQSIHAQTSANESDRMLSNCIVWCLYVLYWDVVNYMNLIVSEQLANF